jgi:hypothetical protein
MRSASSAAALAASAAATSSTSRSSSLPVPKVKCAAQGDEEGRQAGAETRAR